MSLDRQMVRAFTRSAMGSGLLATPRVAKLSLHDDQVTRIPLWLDCQSEKAEQAATARKNADRLAREAWNARMPGFRGPAPPSPAIGDALNGGYRYLEVKCLGCNTHRPSPPMWFADPNHTRPRTGRMRCRECSAVRRCFQTQSIDRTSSEQNHS